MLTHRTLALHHGGHHNAQTPAFQLPEGSAVASRIVTHLFASAGKFVYETIKGGKPIPTILGAVAGTAVGATLGFVDETLIAFGMFLGAILGAAALAATFPRPAPDAKALAREATDPAVLDGPAKARSLGQVRGRWLGVVGEDQIVMTVLLDRAIFRAPRSSTYNWENFLIERLNGGEIPKVSGHA